MHKLVKNYLSKNFQHFTAPRDQKIHEFYFLNFIHLKFMKDLKFIEFYLKFIEIYEFYFWTAPVTPRRV